LLNTIPDLGTPSKEEIWCVIKTMVKNIHDMEAYTNSQRIMSTETGVMIFNLLTQVHNCNKAVDERKMKEKYGSEYTNALKFGIE
jgi:hypothetical protein